MSLELVLLFDDPVLNFFTCSSSQDPLDQLGSKFDLYIVIVIKRSTTKIVVDYLDLHPRYTVNVEITFVSWNNLCPIQML